MSYIKQFLTALYRFSSYPELLKLRGVKAFVYTFFTVILTVIIMTGLSVPGYLSMGGIEGFAKKYIPDFTIKNGELSMDKVDFEDKQSGVRIYIDTTSNELDTSKAGDAICVFIANRDELYVYNGVQAQSMTFKELGFIDISSKDILNKLADQRVRISIVLFVTLAAFLGLASKAAYNVVMLALIGNIINLIVTRLPLRFSQMLKLSCYARTLPLILSLVAPLITGVPFSSIIFYTVGAYYMYMGLKNIKTQDGIVIADISGLQNN